MQCLILFESTNFVSLFDLFFIKVSWQFLTHAMRRRPKFAKPSEFSMLSRRTFFSKFKNFKIFRNKLWKLPFSETFPDGKFFTFHKSWCWVTLWHQSLQNIRAFCSRLKINGPEWKWTILKIDSRAYWTVHFQWTHFRNAIKTMSLEENERYN